MSFLRRIFRFLFNMSLTLLLLLTSVEAVAFSEPFYRFEYARLGRYDAIGLGEGQLMDLTRGLIGYLRGDREDLSMRITLAGYERQVFNERETAHMQDVRALFEKGFMLRNLLLLFCALMLALAVTGRKWRNNLSKLMSVFPWFSAIFLICCASLGVYTVLNFEAVFIKFHHLLFTNDLWLLNPETDILIQMLPTQFFIDTTILIGVLFIAEQIGLSVALGIGSRFVGAKKEDEREEKAA